MSVYGLNAYAVNTAPDAYDIVSVAFPYRENPGEPGPKLRPGLVLSKSVHTEEKTGTPYATLQIAYGTSASVRNINPLDVFDVHNYVALQKSGLCSDTHFLLSRIQKLMWCEEFFPIVEKFETPVMGKLPHDHIISLKKVKEVRDSLKSKGISW